MGLPLVGNCFHRGDAPTSRTIKIKAHCETPVAVWYPPASS